MKELFLYTEKEVKELFNRFLNDINTSEEGEELLYDDEFRKWFRKNKKK